MKTVARIEKLTKIYRLAGSARHSRTTQETLSAGLRSIWRRVRGRQASYRDFLALDDVSFEVGEGEIVGIIGRNGAGKSTLLKILSRITEPTSGLAELHGRLGSLLEVGTGFHPELSGRENIFLNGSLLGMSRFEIRTHFDSIVAFAEMEPFLDTAVKRYSSGMYVRLAFAIAAHLHPEILVLDEVLAVGDAAFQKKCLGKMQDVAGSGRTILFVSHDLHAVRRLCQRVLLLSQGRLLAQGATNAIVDRYLQEETDLLQPGQDLSLAGTQRRGTGTARFTQVHLHSGATSGQIESNSSLAVSVTIEAQKRIESDSIAVVIADRSGTKLLNGDSYIIRKKILLTPGLNTATIHFKTLPLNPGIYTLSLWLAQRPATVFDYLENVGDFEVHTPVATTRLFPNEDGLIWSEFELTGNSS